MFIAAQAGQKEIIFVLVSVGADVNQQDKVLNFLVRYIKSSFIQSSSYCSNIYQILVVVLFTFTLVFSLLLFFFFFFLISTALHPYILHLTKDIKKLLKLFCLLGEIFITKTRFGVLLFIF